MYSGVLHMCSKETCQSIDAPRFISSKDFDLSVQGTHHNLFRSSDRLNVFQVIAFRLWNMETEV